MCWELQSRHGVVGKSSGWEVEKQVRLMCIKFWGRD